MAAPKPSLAYRAKRDPALLKRALADPGLRAKLPSSMLTVAQRRVRSANQANAALGDITTPLSGAPLLGAAKQITEGAFAPAYAGLQQQTDQTNAREQQSSQRAQSIYQQLGAYLQHAVDAQHAAGQQSVASMGAINAQQQNELGAAAQQVQAQQAADARVRGEGLDGGGNAAAAQRMADFGQMSAAQEGTRAGLTNQNAQAADALLAGIAGATAQQGGEVQGRIHDAATQMLQQLASKRAGLDSQKAGAYADTLQKLRQSAIDQNITQKGLGIKTDAANASQANADRNYKLQARKVKDAEKNAQYKRDHPAKPAGDLNGDGKVDAQDLKIRYQINHPGGAKGKNGYLPKGQENKQWAKLDKFAAGLTTQTAGGKIKGANGKSINAADDNAILTVLQAEGLSNREAYVVLSMYRHSGALSPKAARYVRGLGMHIGSRNVIGAGSPTAQKVAGGVGSVGAKVGNLLG